MSPISVTSFSCQRDNLTIRGLIYRPQGKNLPIAILSHGIMVNYSTTQNYARWFAEHGYLALCFDFNGGSPDTTSDPDTRKMTVFTELCDLKAVIAYAKTLEGADPASVLLMGFSQGGVVSALAARELGAEIEKLVLFYPAFCIPDDAKKGKALFTRFDPKNVPEVIQCGPMELGRGYVTTMQDFDLLGAISPFQGKVLMVHGTKDYIVDTAYVEKAQKAYADAQLFLLEGGGHGFKEKYEAMALDHLENFISSKP